MCDAMSANDLCLVSCIIIGSLFLLFIVLLHLISGSNVKSVLKKVYPDALAHPDDYIIEATSAMETGWVTVTKKDAHLMSLIEKTREYNLKEEELKEKLSSLSCNDPRCDEVKKSIDEVHNACLDAYAEMNEYKRTRSQRWSFSL